MILFAGAVGYKAAVWAHSPKAGGIFLGLTVLFAFYGFCFLAVKAGHGIAFLRKLPGKEQVRSLLWLIGLNVFTCLEMALEKKVYYWDASAYWQKTTEGRAAAFSVARTADPHGLAVREQQRLQYGDSHAFTV